MVCNNLEEVRANIDRIDDIIIKLIAERETFVVQASAFKKDEEYDKYHVMIRIGMGESIKIILKKSFKSFWTVPKHTCNNILLKKYSETKNSIMEKSKSFDFPRCVFRKIIKAAVWYNKAERR